MNRNIQLAGILLAGCVSFYGAMTWLRPMLVEADSIAEPAVRQTVAANDATVEGVTDTAHPQHIAPARELALVRPQTGRAIPEGEGSAFSTQSWVPPPPVVRPAPPPPPPKPEVPVAPPLPYVYLGLIERSNAKPQAFLGKGETMLTVVAGDALEGVYRVESLTAQQVVITHLPTNTTQTLTIPGNSK